jgi:hypothetical protein
VLQTRQLKSEQCKQSRLLSAFPRAAHVNAAANINNLICAAAN